MPRPRPAQPPPPAIPFSPPVAESYARHCLAPRPEPCEFQFRAFAGPRHTKLRRKSLSRRATRRERQTHPAEPWQSASRPANPQSRRSSFPFRRPQSGCSIRPPHGRSNPSRKAALRRSLSWRPCCDPPVKERNQGPAIWGNNTAPELAAWRRNPVPIA